MKAQVFHRESDHELPSASIQALEARFSPLLGFAGDVSQGTQTLIPGGGPEGGK